jgi:hypothetical protein
MSLMQLLTVTRSIKTVKDQPSPYKMKQEHLLPRFSAPKSGDGEVAPVATTETLGTEATRPHSWKGFFRRWIGRGREWRRNRAAGRLPVQTELLLGAVRVVRNDFREANVFSGKLPSRDAPVPRTRAVAGQWWLRIQTRLFAQRRKQI